MKEFYIKQKGFNLSRLSFYIYMPLLSLLLMSSGGGGGGKNSKNENYKSNSCTTKTSTLVLHFGNINTGIVPTRSHNYPAFQPATNNIFLGGRVASSLHENKNLNYCQITITATNCSNYGKGGTKVYTWDSSNDGDRYDSRMNIEIPEDGSFTLTVKLYEGCGSWYVGNRYRRAMWRHQGNYFPTNIISVSNWWFSRVDDC